MDPDETAELAARREIREEVGLEVGEMSFLMTAPNSYAYRGVVHPVLDIFFVAEVDQGQEIQHDDEEVTSWMWVTPTAEVLDRMAFLSNRQALERFLQR